MSYFDYCTGLKMTNSRFESLFEDCSCETAFEQFMDVAASIQKVLDDTD